MYDPFKDIRKINIPLENLKTQISLANNIQKQFESQIDMALLKSEIYAPHKDLVENIERMSNLMLEIHRSHIERTLESIRFASKVINDYPLSLMSQLNEAMKIRITPSLNLQYSAIISEMINVPQFNVSAALETMEENYVPNIDDEYDLDATRFKRAFPISYKITESLIIGDATVFFKNNMEFLIDHLMILTSLLCLYILLKGHEEEYLKNEK